MLYLFNAIKLPHHIIFRVVICHYIINYAALPHVVLSYVHTSLITKAVSFYFITHYAVISFYTIKHRRPMCFIHVVISYDIIIYSHQFVSLYYILFFKLLHSRCDMSLHHPNWSTLYHPTCYNLLSHHHLSSSILPCLMISSYITSLLVTLHITLPYDIILYYIITYHPSCYFTLWYHPILHYLLSSFILPYLDTSNITLSLITLHVTLPYDIILHCIITYHPPYFLTLWSMPSFTLSYLTIIILLSSFS